MPPRQSPNRSATRSSTRLECFAAAAPGLEKLVAGELTSFGIPARPEEGGVAFNGTFDVLARVNLWLRTASRVIVRVATFRAQAFHELERIARAIAWERFMTPGAPVRFRVTSRKSRLYHTGAIEERFSEAIGHRLGRASAHARPSAADEEEHPASDAQLFVIRALHDNFTVSVDSSGDLLHVRGYRQAVAKAPVRETLAAAMLLAGDWNGSTPLVDPMCGSGTIPIEGALIARRMAPGLNRSFAFERWPEVRQARWTEIRDDARSAARAKAPIPIRGADRDAGAIEAARANAERAGVSADVELSVQSLSALKCSSTLGGTVATNPPYGVRLGEAAALRDLYARFGQILRARCSDWRLVLLSGNSRLDAQLRVRLEERVRTRSGGIPVRILVGRPSE